MSTAIVTEIRTTLSPEEFREMSGFPLKVFDELQELGAFDEFLSNGRFRSATFRITHRAENLRRVFELDANSLALILHFMGEAETLRDDLRKARLCNIKEAL